MAQDAYDSCIAHIDEHLGRLSTSSSPRGPRSDLGDHRLGPRRELRRACRHLLPRDEPLPDRAPRPADRPSPGGGADHPGRCREGEPAGDPGDDRRPGGLRGALPSRANRWPGSGGTAGSAPAIAAGKGAERRHWPRWFPTIQWIRIPRGCSSRDGRWPP